MKLKVGDVFELHICPWCRQVYEFPEFCTCRRNPDGIPETVKAVLEVKEIEE